MSILSGVKIIEMEGIGPGPFAAMHLADLGADVVRIAKPNSRDPLNSLIMRGKKVVPLDLKNEADKDALKRLIAEADGLIEGMRPGVMERLGLGPDVCLEINPKLAYGRLTGWGQDGPLAQAAGHDLNYIALSGALWYAGAPGTRPFSPPSLIGDIAGGALYLTIGLLAAILKAQKTGKGDVIDAAMVDGSAHMMNLLLSLLPSGLLNMERGKTILDGPHWYDSYECLDGEFVTIGSLEPKFYGLLLKSLGLEDNPDFSQQINMALWPSQKEKLTAIFKTKTQEEWCAQMEGTDICFAPVLNPLNSAKHSHMKARDVYREYQGHIEASPAPRFSHHQNSESRINAKETTIQTLIAEWRSP